MTTAPLAELDPDMIEDIDPVAAQYIADRAVFNEKWKNQEKWNTQKDESELRIYEKLSGIERRLYLTVGAISILSTLLGNFITPYLSK